MRNGRFATGVVGQSRGTISPVVTQCALEVGTMLTQEPQILVTGGKPKRCQRVKDAAMCGAKVAGSSGMPARLLSILRGENALKPDVNLNLSDPAVKHLIVQTSFAKDERNLLTGCIPDALIAINGGKGTSSEIAIALALGIPVIFVQVEGPSSINTVQSLGVASSAEVKNILLEIQKCFPFFDVSNFYDRLATHISQRKYETATTASDAVNKAIQLAQSRPFALFNNLPPHRDFIGIYDKYENYMWKLAT